MHYNLFKVFETLSLLYLYSLVMIIYCYYDNMSKLRSNCFTKYMKLQVFQQLRRL